jgi:purine-binding chemotaxis protein CheW
MKIQGGKFLAFLWGQEVYGIPIKQVKEIIGMMEITSLPKVQGYLKGIINLRGKNIPIVDLRLKFGIEAEEGIGRTCIIVIEINVLEDRRLVGFAVDSVSEVISILKSDLEPPPEFEARVEGDLLAGLGKFKGKVILILNTDNILNQEELAYLNQELNGK